MEAFMPLFKFLSRRNRMQAYRQARKEMEMISDADLADMGIKLVALDTHVGEVSIGNHFYFLAGLAIGLHAVPAA